LLRVLRHLGGMRKLSALLLLYPLLAHPVQATTLRVGVAANFRATAEALATEFVAGKSDRIVFSSASTGVLAAQLRSGAPFDLMLAADRERPEALHREGFASGEPRCYAGGTLVLLGATDMHAALSDPLRRLAIANPATAPYGAAAVEVLARDSFASGAGRRLIRGANVLQAYQYFHSGAADLALVARSLSPDAGIRVPQEWHLPIVQYALINARSEQPELAREFLNYITGSDAANVLSQRGYLPCS
jgi:molybdate transport system substrate-binding protein